MPVDTFPPVDAAMSNSSSNNRSRAQSISSDRPSTIGVYSLMSPPLSVSPEAAFIAASAASQIVTTHHDSRSETWYDQVGVEPSAETILVSRRALQLANNFLDQLLFNLLASAKSTTLSSLRAAVVEVLKPKLAKDVINLADEELREFLPNTEVDDLGRSASLEASNDWDLELVWKRTRLRCMVYSSLGDLEEEDEDYHMEQEHLTGEAGDVMAEVVSPAVAIFLTSILEYMGEQVLVVAGQAAFNRVSAKYEIELREGSRLAGTVSDRLVVEELDMERVALDRTFGRLWRAWKKKIRSPTEPNFSRPFSQTSTGRSALLHQRRESSTTEVPAVPELDASENQSSQKASARDQVDEPAEDDNGLCDPSMLPLPDSDVEATYSDEEESEDEEETYPRPKSWFGPFNSIDIENAFSSQVSLKRTPSLPSRKKPWSTPIPTIEEYADGAQVVDAPEVTIEIEAADNAESETSEFDENAAYGAAMALATIHATNDTRQTVTDEDFGDDSTDYEIDSEIEEFTEEPQIMTSSRISVTGRSSPENSDSGRPSSIVLTRSSSVRSVRVIEVQGPRSRASSVETDPLSPSVRSFSISREGSISRTPPIVEEADPYTGPFITSKTAPGMPSENNRDANTMLAPPPRHRSPPKSVPSNTSSVRTKMTNGGSMPQEERHDGFQRPLSGLRNPPMPTLPERSTSRPIYVQTASSLRASPDSPNFPRSIRTESPTSARFKAKRGSEESGSSSPADVARNFEELIQSNQTLQFTLTPENMRDMESLSSQPGGSPKGSVRTGRKEDGRSEERSRSSSLKSSLSVRKPSGPGSYAPKDMKVNGKYGNATSKALPPLKNRPIPVSQARDARIPRESMQDFADFIRSTGPPSEHVARAVRTPTAGSNTARSATGPPTLVTGSSMEARRPKLQARDAVVTTSNESSELIDFIRRGPPSTNGSNPRIPRTVAPFRNTQDSDYMTSAVGGKAIDAIIPNVRTSQASTNITEVSAPSSMNSQSALLNQSSWQQQHPFGNGVDEDELMPKRTRRRVRDPYAVDLSEDEDEDEFYATPPKPPAKKEESLIDFLNSYPPPDDLSVRPIVPPKKKSSTPNLIARLRSGSSSGLGNSGHGRKGSAASQSRGLNGRGPNGRGGVKATHTPIVVPIVADGYNSPITSPAPPRAASYNRVPMKKFEPREPTASTASIFQTADLANFLRDSAPPPSMTALPSPPEDKSSTGFSRIFERRKKTAAY